MASKYQMALEKFAADVMAATVLLYDIDSKKLTTYQRRKFNRAVKILGISHNAACEALPDCEIPF